MVAKKQAPKPKTSGAGKKQVIFDKKKRTGTSVTDKSKPAPAKPKPKAPAKKK